MVVRAGRGQKEAPRSLPPPAFLAHPRSLPIASQTCRWSVINFHVSAHICCYSKEETKIFLLPNAPLRGKEQKADREVLVLEADEE